MQIIGIIIKWRVAKVQNGKEYPPSELIVDPNTGPTKSPMFIHISNNPIFFSLFSLVEFYTTKDMPVT